MHRGIVSGPKSLHMKGLKAGWAPGSQQQSAHSCHRQQTIWGRLRSLLGFLSGFDSLGQSLDFLVKPLEDFINIALHRPEAFE